MPLLISTLEDRLRFRIGDLVLQNEAHQQRIDELLLEVDRLSRAPDSIEEDNGQTVSGEKEDS